MPRPRHGQPDRVAPLIGQCSGYLAGQLRAFHSRERHDGLYARMRTIAGALTDAEVADLAACYAVAYR